MAAKADDLKNTRTERDKPVSETPARPAAYPPRPTRVSSVSEVIKRSVAKHPRVLELLAKR